MVMPVERSAVARGASPRLINVALGVWLFVSAFLWRHSHAQLTNTWIVGVLCVLVALVGMAVPRARYINTLLAIWLFVSAWALPTISVGTIWNNVLVSIAVFVISLVPSGPTAAPGYFGRPAPPRPI
jgi:hypothetical protein